MPRLIDADSIKSAKYHDLPYTHIHPVGVDVQAYEMGWNDALDAVADSAPTVDAEPVVRCKDCIYYGDHGDGEMACAMMILYPNKPTDYCSLGERRKDETD